MTAQPESNRQMDAFQLWNYVPLKQRFFALSEKEWLEFDTALAGIAAQRSRIAGLMGTTRDHFLVINQKGSRPPLYWCFNIWAEPLLLAKRLDNDQPLIAMHSLNIGSTTWREKRRFQEHLALNYFQNMHLDKLTRPPVIVGNCQGAPIAEAIAILACQRLDIRPLLITLEYTPRRDYPGPRLMLFGKESRFNPFYNSHKDPASIWQTTYPEFAWGFIAASHGGYFKNQGLHQLQWFVDKGTEIVMSGAKLPCREITYDE